MQRTWLISDRPNEWSSPYVNLTTASKLLKVKPGAVTGLIRLGRLGDDLALKYRPNSSLLIPRKDLESFSSLYISVAAVAKEQGITIQFLNEQLRVWKVDLLRVPRSLKGKGNTLFISKSILADLITPSGLLERELMKMQSLQQPRTCNGNTRSRSLNVAA
jgi:hypothetical protein